MAESALPTQFLPAEKAEPAEVKRQMAMILASSVLPELLDAMMGFALILNKQRQVVFANKAFQSFLREHKAGPIIGQRYGDVMGCVNSARTPGGCGTTEFCRVCGAAQAVASAVSGQTLVNECRLQSQVSGDDLDLLVRGSPFKVEGEEFIIFAAVDVSHEKRRRALERIFFHDVINTAGGIQGLASVMAMSEPDVAVQKYAPMVSSASDRLLEEIISQRDLASAEIGELKPKAAPVNSKGLLSDLAALFSHHQVGKDRTIVLAPGCEDLALTTDRTLLLRVLGNLIKNALESVPAGAEVRVSSRREGDRAVFTIHNPTVMPREVQLQIFQRSFSTKGSGRGLGTYSIRLLTERYLKGKVSFTSSPGTGTVFTAIYPLTLDGPAQAA